MENERQVRIDNCLRALNEGMEEFDITVEVCNLTTGMYKGEIYIVNKEGNTIESYYLKDDEVVLDVLQAMVFMQDLYGR